jgi:hypothetical protein
MRYLEELRLPSVGPGCDTGIQSLKLIAGKSSAGLFALGSNISAWYSSRPACLFKVLSRNHKHFNAYALVEQFWYLVNFFSLVISIYAAGKITLHDDGAAILEGFSMHQLEWLSDRIVVTKGKPFSCQLLVFNYIYVPVCSLDIYVLIYAAWPRSIHCADLAYQFGMEDRKKSFNAFKDNIQNMRGASNWIK